MTPGMLPLDTEEWVDELLTRLFAVLTHLEAPETRSEGSAGAQTARRGSFLLDKTCMYKCAAAPTRELCCRGNTSTAPAGRQMHSPACPPQRRCLVRWLGLTCAWGCRPLLGLLFSSLPVRARPYVAKKVARFLTSSSLPSVGKECGLLARYLAEVCLDLPRSLWLWQTPAWQAHAAPLWRCSVRGIALPAVQWLA